MESGIYAKDLFVATDGSDSVTYENNDINNPWLTVEKGWYNALAGDVVYFRTGTYVITTTIDTKSQGANGTAENPITFRNYSQEEVTFSSELSDNVFKIQKNYNYVQGIACEGKATFFWLGEDLSASHFEIRDCSYAMSVGGDNVGFVKGGGNTSPYLVVERCIIVGPGAANGIHNNTSGIYCGRLEYMQILNCEISHIPIGIYFKHANPESDTGNEIAYNYIHDTGRYSIFTNSHYTNIHDNLVGANNAKMRVNEANGVPGGDYNNIHHNTFYNVGIEFSCDSGGALSNTLKDNIIMQQLELHEYCATTHSTTMDYNLYPSGDIVRENSVDYTLSEWQSHHGGDGNSLSGKSVIN